MKYYAPCLFLDLVADLGEKKSKTSQVRPVSPHFSVRPSVPLLPRVVDKLSSQTQFSFLSNHHDEITIQSIKVPI